MTAQTRLAAMFQHNAVGWFLATLLSALLHATFGVVARSCLVCPIGTMIPTLLLHGTNVWGLPKYLVGIK